MMVKSGTWSMRLTLPSGDPQGDPRYNANIEVTVMTDTLERAVQLTREQYPAATIFAATHRGAKHLLLDPRIAVAAPPVAYTLVKP